MMSEKHPAGQGLEELLEHLDAEHWSDEDRRRDERVFDSDCYSDLIDDDNIPAVPFAECDRCGEPIWDAEDAFTLFVRGTPTVCIDCWHRTIGLR